MGTLIILLILPALLMGMLLWALPKDALVIRAPSRKLMIIAALGIAILTLIFLALPDYDRWYFQIVFIFSPPFLIGIQGILLYSALHTSSKIGWGQLLVSAVMLALTYFALYNLTSMGLLAPLFAMGIALATTGVTLVVGIWLIWVLSGWRKSISVVSLIVVPLTLVAGVAVGNTRAPESITHINGSTIAQALEQFYEDRRMYPQSLRDLIPVYLQEIPEALTTQGTGWLYVSSGDEYTLGYWYWPDNCTTLCKYNTRNPVWSCDIACLAEDWRPFTPVPTPNNYVEQPTPVIGPDEATIIYPMTGDTVSGKVTIEGTVSFSKFDSYGILYSPTHPFADSSIRSFAFPEVCQWTVNPGPFWRALPSCCSSRRRRSGGVPAPSSRLPSTVYRLPLPSIRPGGGSDAVRHSPPFDVLIC